MRLTLALNYSARSEIVDAFRSLAEAASRNGGLGHLQVDEQAISDHLYTRGLPDPDLVIRTSGEMRLSNFLLCNLPTPKSTSPKRCGPTFAAFNCSKASKNIRSASAATVAWHKTVMPAACGGRTHAEGKR